ncbi:hypothetical protein ACOMHN_039700 [Nucella lapillus]
MKVRVKLAGVARTVDVGDIQQCSLLQLQQRTADVFELGETSFSLSLNKTDALSGEDQTLTQLGIVPGDLVFILSPDLPGNVNSSTNNINNVTPSPSTSSSSCASSGVPQVADADAGMAEGGSDGGAVGGKEATAVSASQTVCEESEGAQDSAAVGAHASCSEVRDAPSPSPLEDPEVNRCLQEPLLCRESTPASVPVILRDLFGSAGCSGPSDALWLVIHTLMLEVGFRPLQEEDFSLGAGWNRRGFYKQEYRHLCVNAEHSCSLIGVPMGKVIIVHGVTNGNPPLKTDPQTLKVTDYVQDSDFSQDVCSVYRNLERLSRTVKDLICQHLMGQLSEVCGFPVSVGLLSLSYEIQLKVLNYLSASSLSKVGQVCRTMNATYRDPCLWRRLYLREFGQKGDNSLNKNWYQLYKEAHQLRKERRRWSRHRQQMLMSVPPWLHPPHGHFSSYPPPPGFQGGIVGGDYDLNPEFASSIPSPLGGHPLGPNPFLPQGPGGIPGGPFMPRPRFGDPFGPGSGPGPHFMGLGGTSRSTVSMLRRSLGGHRFM